LELPWGVMGGVIFQKKGAGYWQAFFQATAPIKDCLQKRERGPSEYPGEKVVWRIGFDGTKPWVSINPWQNGQETFELRSIRTLGLGKIWVTTTGDPFNRREKKVLWRNMADLITDAVFCGVGLFVTARWCGEKKKNSQPSFRDFPGIMERKAPISCYPGNSFSGTSFLGEGFSIPPGRVKLAAFGAYRDGLGCVCPKFFREAASDRAPE